MSWYKVNCFPGASILFDLLMHQHGPGEGLGVNGFNNTADSLDDTDTSQVIHV